MLPPDLIGPEKAVYYADEAMDFYIDARQRYPDLDKDFILDCCVHHPSRFCDLLPNLDLAIHQPVRREVSASWIAQAVRYDDNERLDSSLFYSSDVEDYLEQGRSRGGWLLSQMLEQATWPHAPIIVASAFASNELHITLPIGPHYHLMEGCRRVSFLLGMLRTGLISPESKHEVVELTFR